MPSKYCEEWERKCAELEADARSVQKDFDEVVAVARVAVATRDFTIAVLTRERDEAIAHDRQPHPTAWAYEQTCKALEKAKAQVEQLTYERDRARMMADASGHLAEDRMYRIFELEKQLNGETP